MDNALEIIGPSFALIGAFVAMFIRFYRLRKLAKRTPSVRIPIRVYAGEASPKVVYYRNMVQPVPEVPVSPVMSPASSGVSIQDFPKVTIEVR